MSEIIAVSPASLEGVDVECAAIETWAEQCVDVAELREATVRLAAIDEYLSRTSTNGRARVAAAMRRLEARIGELLGPAEPTPGPGRGKPSIANDGLSRDQRSEFRQMAANPDVVEKVIGDSTDDDPASRRKVMRAIRNPALYTSESPEWYTPAHIIDRTVDLLGGIDLDPCSNSHDVPNVPARRHFTEADDGLSQPWIGTVYMNPPYGSGIAAWIDKLVSECEAGNVSEAIALVPARTDTTWFRRFRDAPRCFVLGRLKFSGHDNSAPFPSAVVYLGVRLAAFCDSFRDVGDIYVRAET